jgi:hypothetical protein
MRIFNRAHVAWLFFVIIATAAAAVLYTANFHPQGMPAGIRLPSFLIQAPSEHRSVGGTPLGLIFGTIAFAIFIFAGLLGVRKKVVLWRMGTLQLWMRAHIWLTLLTIPLIFFHSGFRMGGPMTTLLVSLYAIVMVSGIYGLALQHQMPRIMKERLPAETVYEQIPHIRAQLVAAAQKMRDSFKPAASPQKADAGAPVLDAAKAATSGSTPMASTSADISTPTARAKSVVGSTITAETVAAPVATASPVALAPVPAGAASTATAPTPQPPATPQPAVVQQAAAATPAADVASEAALIEFFDQSVLPYLSARRGDKSRLGNGRYSEDLFRLVKLRVAEGYRGRVEEIQGWCDERRMLDLQIRLQHWLHGWLFVHVPISFLLILLTAWHAYVTLFYY